MKGPMSEWQAKKFAEIREMYDLTKSRDWISRADCTPADAQVIALIGEFLPASIDRLEEAVSNIKIDGLRNQIVICLREFAELAYAAAGYHPPKAITERVLRRHRGKGENDRLNRKRKASALLKHDVLCDAIRTVLGQRTVSNARSTPGLRKGEIDQVLQLVRSALGTEVIGKWPSRATIQSHAAPLIAEWSRCSVKSKA